MQYPKVLNNNSSWAVPEVQSGEKVNEQTVSPPDTDQTNSSVLFDSDQTNLIVNYLPYDMTEKELFDIFDKFGDILKLKIIRDRHSELSLGYAFVNFRNASAARVAQAMCDQYEIRGKYLKVAFARPQGEKIDQANLYVANLPPYVDERKLVALFGGFGTIIEVRLLRCRVSGKSRCAGFVHFDQRMSAELAIKALDKYVFKDSRRPILVKFANKPSKPLGFSLIDDAIDCVPTKRHIDPEILPAAKRLQNSYPFSCPTKTAMEPEIDLMVKRGIESYPLPLAVNRHIKPKVHQQQMDPKIQQLQINPRTKLPGQPSQAPNPYPWLVKRPIEPEIQMAIKPGQAPNSYPCLVKRPMGTAIDQITQRSEGQQPFLEPVMRHTEPKIQKHQMEPMCQQRQIDPRTMPPFKPSQAPNPYPWLVNELAAKRTTEQYISSQPVKYHIDPKIHQPQMEPKIQQRQIDPRIKPPGEPSQAPNPYPWLVQRPMEPQIQMAVNPTQASNSYPFLVQRPMEKEIQQFAMPREGQYPVPEPDKRHIEQKKQNQMAMTQQSQIDPRIKPPVKPSQAPNPYPWLVKQPMEPEIDHITKHREQPTPFPLPIKLEMEPSIQKHHMEAKIQQRHLDPETEPAAVKRCQAPNPYPCFVKRPMEPEVEPITKRASGYIDPYEK